METIFLCLYCPHQYQDIYELYIITPVLYTISEYKRKVNTVTLRIVRNLTLFSMKTVYFQSMVPQRLLFFSTNRMRYNNKI